MNRRRLRQATEADLESPAIIVILMAICVVVHIVLLIYLANTRFPNIDELAHLPAGVSHWKYLEFDLYEVSPPLIDMFAGLGGLLNGVEYDWRFYSELPGARPEFTIGLDRLDKGGLGVQRDFFLPRLFCIPFSVFGCLIGVAWTRQVIGILPACVFCASWCFSPSMLASGYTIIPDMGSVSVLVACLYVSRMYIQMPNARNAIILGMALGMLLLSKLTWIFTLVLIPILVAYLSRRRQVPGGSVISHAKYCTLQIIIALLVLNAGYFFEGSFRCIGDYDFCSQMLGGPEADMFKTGNRFRAGWLSRIPIPLPCNYVEGFDFLRFELERGYWSFLNGEWKHGAWPHYYLESLLLKTPLIILMIFAFGLLAVVKKAITSELSAGEFEYLSLFLLPTSIAVLLISAQGGFNHHHRYVLMAYPACFAVSAFAFTYDSKSGRGQWYAQNVKAFAVCGILSISVLLQFPYVTSYFNLLSGGPNEGWRYLGFSNIDWGQDLCEVKRWVDDNQGCRPLAFDLDYFDVGAPFFGLEKRLPEYRSSSESAVPLENAESMWIVVSVKKLYNKGAQPGLAYLREIEPVARIGYSYRVYRIGKRF